MSKLTPPTLPEGVSPSVLPPTYNLPAVLHDGKMHPDCRAFIFDFGERLGMPEQVVNGLYAYIYSYLRRFPGTRMSVEIICDFLAGFSQATQNLDFTKANSFNYLPTDRDAELETLAEDNFYTLLSVCLRTDETDPLDLIFDAFNSLESTRGRHDFPLTICAEASEAKVQEMMTAFRKVHDREIDRFLGLV